MSDFVKVKKLTSATGGTVNFPNGINIAGSDSGITGSAHTVSETEPSTPANGDTWYDTENEIYYVRMDNAWKSWLGSPSPEVGGNIDDGSTTIANYTYDNVSFDTGTANVNQMHWKTDGTKVYVLTQGSSGEILEINLSTAWDLSTATDSGSSWSGFLSQAPDGSYGLNSSTDGTKFYTVNYSNDTIYQYSLSTAWDISTASYANKSYDLGDAGFNDIQFNPTGTKMYCNESSSDTIRTHTLSTAWDVSTTSYDGASYDLDYSVADSTTSTLGVTFSPDGTSFFILAYLPSGNKGNIYQWDLTTAYDLSTASLTSNTLNVKTSGGSTVDSEPVDIKFSSDGTKLYFMGRFYDAIYQWSISSSGSSSVYNGARGFWFGGTTYGAANRVNTIEYVTISTPGNAQDFGDLTVARWANQGASSGTRGVMPGGKDVNNNELNVIDYITCATAGNAVDFGDLTLARAETSSASNGTRGVIFNGRESVAGRVNTIEYVTIATTGNAQDFGDSLAVRTGNTAVNGETRALNAGSYDWATNDIEYVTVDTTGNATDFGDLTDPSTKGGSAADATRGLIALGANTATSPNQTNKIDYVTHATTGNAQDFGDLTVARRNQPSGCSDGTYACFGGGEDAPTSNELDVIDRVTIQTTGNATDFGDLTSARKTVGSLAGAAS